MSAFTFAKTLPRLLSLKRGEVEKPVILTLGLSPATLK